MREGWKELRLGELCELNNGSVQTGPFGAQLHEYDYTLEGVGVIMPKDIIGNTVNENTLAYISDEMALKLKKYRVKIGDIVYPRRGDIAKRAFIRNDMPLLCGTGCIRIRFEGKNIDKKYINYYLSTDETINWLENNSVGATMKNLSTKILKDLPINLPPLETQRKIASILSGYDDLIENNLKRIKILEEMAQQTYEEWFVRMRFPGYETAVLNEESGLPEGWEKVKLIELYDLKYGKNLPQTEILKVEDFCVYGASGKMGYYSKNNISEKKVLVTSRGNGSGVVHRTFESKSFVTNNSFIVNTKLGLGYTFYNLTKFDLSRYNSGSAQPQLTNSALLNVEILRPDFGLINMFNLIVNKEIEIIDNLREQNQRLRESRDILLPRLMMGMIEVDGLEVNQELGMVAESGINYNKI